MIGFRNQCVDLLAVLWVYVQSNMQLLRFSE